MGAAARARRRRREPQRVVPAVLLLGLALCARLRDPREPALAAGARARPGGGGAPVGVEALEHAAALARRNQADGAPRANRVSCASPPAPRVPPLLHLLRAHARAPRRRAARAGRVGSVTRYRHRRALGPGTASTWTARRSKLSSVPCWTQRCRAAAPSACGPRRYWSRPPVRPPRALRPSRSCCAPRRVCPAAPHSCSLAWLTGRERAQVEVIVHMYVHAGAIAGDAVTAMLRELVLASEPHLRVTALKIVVNAALRTQLLLDWCQTPESEEPEQSEHHELVEGANKDLRSQLLRLTALAFHEELLDAQMSDVAISGVLLLCTDDGNFDQMLRTHLPLEVLAALVSHRYSSLCASPVVGE